MPIFKIPRIPKNPGQIRQMPAYFNRVKTNSRKSIKEADSPENAFLVLRVPPESQLHLRQNAHLDLAVLD